jgi:peroxiredoxin Q/BCP
MQLKVGNKAPAFSAKDQTGGTIKLSNFRNKWLLLYFYPKDFTSGCTKEACSFRDHFQKLKKSVKIVGVSSDSVESHRKFISKLKLPFTLLADQEKRIVSIYGKKAGINVRRFSYLINNKGKIAKVYRSVKPESHAQQVMKDLKVLQS